VTLLTTIDRTRRVASWSSRARRPRSGSAVATACPDRESLARRGRIALAADILGACEPPIEMAVAYAKQREQFGRTIATFQAVKHLCAEMVAELEPARSLLWYAAYAFDERPEEVPLLALHAKAHFAEIGTFIVRTATEVHGGIGFTDAYDLQLWFKRVGSIANSSALPNSSAPKPPPPVRIGGAGVKLFPCQVIGLSAIACRRAQGVIACPPPSSLACSGLVRRHAHGAFESDLAPRVVAALGAQGFLGVYSRSRCSCSRRWSGSTSVIVTRGRNLGAIDQRRRVVAKLRGTGRRVVARGGRRDDASPAAFVVGDAKRPEAARGPIC